MPPPLPASGLNFTYNPSLSEFAVPMKDYLHKHPQYGVIGTGALVFTSAPESTDAGGKRLLLLQRAAHDSNPLRWEVPGGAVNLEDESILHGLAREVWEETQLLVTRVVRRVGVGQTFKSRKGQQVLKLSFEVEVKGTLQDRPEVTMDPNEHADFVWVTEDEARRHWADGPTAIGKQDLEMQITSSDQEEIMWEGYRLARGEEAQLTGVLGSIAWE
ncbi:hypothetical protein GQ53DRAFT_742185 [Thozetella sp. PMI_491]|nr:hypothetical protein GQ53DRAFT_742185 [Thozetella sp. PMI_491]